jgi:hypothetical protein
MQDRAEMPKSVGQGVSLGLRGTKQVPVASLLLLAAVGGVTGQWEILVKLAVHEGHFLSVNSPSCVILVLGVALHPLKRF